MRCSIEMNTLRVMHVHPSAAVLDALAALEATAAPYDVLLDNADNNSFLHKLTTLELSKLYLNLTGKELTTAVGRAVLRSAVAHVVNNTAPRDAVLVEVLAQLEYAVENPGPVYRYVKGASIPAVPDAGLWPVKGQHLTKAQFEAAELDAKRLTELTAAPVPASAPRAPSRPAAEPKGGSRPTIWAHADKVWEAAGKPMQQDAVLKLRKQMMVDLEEQGIKKSTSSTALGDWMKTRLAVA